MLALGPQIDFRVVIHEPGLHLDQVVPELHVPELERHPIQLLGQRVGDRDELRRQLRGRHVLEPDRVGNERVRRDVQKLSAPHCNQLVVRVQRPPARRAAGGGAGILALWLLSRDVALITELMRPLRPACIRLIPIVLLQRQQHVEHGQVGHLL